MLYNKAIYEPVESRFNDKRVRARRNIEIRRNEIYSKFPQYKEAEDEIAKLGIKLGRLAISGGSDSEVEEIKNKIDVLSEKKKKILKEAELEENYIHNVYECAKCKDEGYADGKMCTCFAKELADEIAKRSNIASSLKYVTFDDFKTDYYKDAPDENGYNPRKQIKYILDKVADFIQNFGKPQNKNLVLYGNTGLGKTFLSSAIANRLAERGITVMYYTAKQLLGMLTENEFSSNKEYKEESKWVYDVDLLIIDDLGSELVTQYTVAELFDVVNARMLSGKQMIISTNLELSDLAKIYSGRTFSRLAEFEFLKFIGDDIRVMKNM